MPWISRGLRDGVVTTGYPRRPDGYDEDFHGSVEVIGPTSRNDLQRVVSLCPTRAIDADNTTLTLDRGACILCGRCVEALPEVFRFSSSVETSSLGRSSLVVPYVTEDDDGLASAREELARRVRSLRRSVHVRHVDAGSDGADEWEVAALSNPIYDVQRLGIFFTASPRHADVLLVTGVGAIGMDGPLRETWEAMPHPKVVVAAGVEAISGGLFATSYATSGGVSGLVPVDVFVPGSPATPFGLLHGLLRAVNLLNEATPPRTTNQEPDQSAPGNGGIG